MGRLRIDMDSETLQALQRSGYRLVVCRAVSSSDLAGRPLVWRTPSRFLTTVTLEIEGPSTAFVSFSPIAAGETVRVGSSIEASTGQIVEIAPGGLLSLTTGGPAGAVSLHNRGDTAFTCGLGLGAEGEAQPYCAFPIAPGFLQVFVPTEKILVAFTTRPLEAGVVIESLMDLFGVAAASAAMPEKLFGLSPGLLVDLAGAEERRVEFDIGRQWHWEGTWARPVSPTESLVPILITSER